MQSALSTPVLRNANMPTLEMKETKNLWKFFIVVDEMTNILEYFCKKLGQQKEDSSNRIRQMEVCLMTNPDEFEQYIHHAITAYSKKEEIRKLKSKIQKLQEESSKVKHDTSDTKILVRSITGELNQKRTKVMWQAETWKTQKHQTWQNILLQTRNRFVPLRWSFR